MEETGSPTLQGSVGPCHLENRGTNSVPFSNPEVPLLEQLKLYLESQIAECHEVIGRWHEEFLSEPVKHFESGDVSRAE